MEEALYLLSDRLLNNNNKIIIYSFVNCVCGNYRRPMNQTQQHNMHVEINFSLSLSTTYSDVWNMNVYMDGKK